ncbi:hypothetical protein H5J25_04765 [Sphingomonas aliaeris]|uniref:Uncharacterized protein n=1 Tax=Sphingomonas aliaeris TaxID=2759526 RepID=A0A974S5G2_9SPHN|nr:XrtV sorting system accessory protein [Sphingomonas aliaeris]QQV78055.1 hypothetical protein H5J25_04765 [Sphingomonas aliaeris]
METVYDWLTVAIFGGLITLFLQRSSADEPKDKMWQYFPAAIGCAVANYLGNHEQHVLAWLAIAGIGIYVWYVLKPLEHWKK